MYIVLLLLAAGAACLAWFARANLVDVAVLTAAAVMLVTFAFSFKYLLVRDETDHLAMRYGPLPLFRGRIPYFRITAVEEGRSSLIDGWGIHYAPGRGWTYNLWGFGCVKVSMSKKVVRIGTDDVAGMAAFLKTKIATTWED